MTSMWQRTLLYLGLVDEDGLDDAAGGGAPVAQPRPAPAPQPTRPQSLPTTPQVSHVQQAGATPAASQPPGGPVGDQRGGRRVEPPPPSRRRPLEPQQETSRAGSDSGVVVRHSDYSGPSSSHAEIIAAHSFSDAKRLADLVRERVPVVVNLRDTDPDMVRRLVDFSSGLVYALDGTMRKVSDGVILVSPPRVNISSDEEQRLIDLGLFDES